MTNEIDILNVPDQLGYILEVDLEYPKELHDKHNLYQHLNMYRLLMICSHLFSGNNFHRFVALYGKLVPNLHNKEKYVVHYRNLQLYVVEFKKVHRVMQFEQSCWMKPYIDLNIEKRKKETARGDDAAKDLCKLFNNAVFGKTMENLRKRINFEGDCIETHCETARIWLVFTWPRQYW